HHRCVHSAHHLYTQRRSAFMQPGGADENALPLLIRHDALDSIACRLRFRCDDGNFLADETIKQSGLACIWSSDDGHKTSSLCRLAFGGHWLHSAVLCVFAARDFLGLGGIAIFLRRSFKTFVWLASRTSK